LINSKLTAVGSLQNSGTLTANSGTLELAGLTVANTGGTLRTDGGVVDLTNATGEGGALEAADFGFVRFGGDVTLHGVTWSSIGEGGVGADTGTLQFHGDYAHHLPAGYTL